ncbi:uncharacterized protein RAG0_00274 [Rhynchosporium agropyri]|uniref:Secreted protein n=1 Tax=Rhynchosporium agropyri TaxID=914238 RepID=A0A1E1JRT8_9HELO|nr:uncharacterized protein RAG0_00274 [Rhynchosporium agropyri]
MHSAWTGSLHWLVLVETLLCLHTRAERDWVDFERLFLFVLIIGLRRAIQCIRVARHFRGKVDHSLQQKWCFGSDGVRSRQTSQK